MNPVATSTQPNHALRQTVAAQLPFRVQRFSAAAAAELRR
jgi:hypothetical protein